VSVGPSDRGKRCSSLAYLREWLGCGRGEVVGGWSGSGKSVVREWLRCGREVVEVWSGSGQGVVQVWSGVVGMWSGSG